MYLVHAPVYLDHEDSVEARIKRSEPLNSDNVENKCGFYVISITMFILDDFFLTELDALCPYVNGKCIVTKCDKCNLTKMWYLS